MDALEWEGRAATIGYTLAREHWGRGFATEAVDALLTHLFEGRSATRVHAQLHPENVASARVLERSGFIFEGHTRDSYWLGEEASDNWLFGLRRPEWEDWRTRPRDSATDVRLVDITPDSARRVLALRTHKTQEAFVAPVSASMVDALYPEVVDGAPLLPWLRAIEADRELVGFVMVALRTDHHPAPYLWRLLIDRRHQRRGLGDRALRLVEDELRRRGDRQLLVSWAEGLGSPGRFYLERGFEPTGRVVDGEREAAKDLAASGPGGNSSV
jgi:RimJ/RimL family protein N-acetyltransferase